MVKRICYNTRYGNGTFNPCAALLRVALAALPTMTAFGQALPGTVSRTVEVYPGAEKNKAFPLERGSGMCDLTLRARSPWRIRDSNIVNPVSDETLWKKFSPTRCKMSYGYAPDEFVQIEGDLYKPTTGSGEGKVELPDFLVTVPAVNLDWDAKHGDAAKEFAEDSVPAAILVSSDRADFGSLIVYGPKDDFNISSSDVTLSWDNANKVKVYDRTTEIRSGHKFSIMQGASKTLLVEALEPAPDVKFTLEGEPDNVNRERAVDYVHARCEDRFDVIYIKFNHERGSSLFDAIEIRDACAKNPILPYDEGEWNEKAGNNYPACYIANRKTTVVVKFKDKSRGKSDSSAVINAISAENDSFLNRVGSQLVEFRNGESGEVYFDFTEWTPGKVCSVQRTFLWRVSSINGAPVQERTFKETGPHRLYVVLDEPCPPWDPDTSGNVHNPTISALDVVCSVAKGESRKRDALAKVTRYLYNNCGFRYSPVGGQSYGYAPFRLQAYLDKTVPFVNCMDQGVGVSILGKILGIDADCICAEPFGFLNRCNVIGIGECVNPINPTSTIPLCFVRHCFVEFEESVYDACIGPELGTRDRDQYLNRLIDVSGDRFFKSYFYQGSMSVYDYDF